MAQSRNLRWNFGSALIDAAGWELGLTFISVTTILPLFIKELGGSSVAVGMIQAVMLFGLLVPGILVANAIERLRIVRRTVLALALVERFTLLLMAPLCLWLGPTHPTVLLAAFFAVWLISNSATGANMPAYYKLIAKTIPPEYRGRLYGAGNMLSGALGMGVAALAGVFLQHWGFPGGYAACFAGVFIVQFLTVLPLGAMREPEQAPGEAPERERLTKLLRLALDDRRLFWLCCGLGLFSLNQMAAAFYAAYAHDRLGATAADAAQFTVAMMAAKTLAALGIGWLADRYGNRLLLQASTAVSLGAVLLAWLAPTLGWLSLAFSLNQVAAYGWGICAVNYVLELCPPSRSGTYTAVYSLYSGPFRALLPLLGGVLAERFGFQPVFVLGAVGSVAALCVLWRRLPEPRNEALPASGGPRGP